MRALPIIGFFLGSAAIIGAQQVVARRTEGRRRTGRFTGIPARPQETLPAPLPPGSVPAPGGIAVPWVPEPPPCPPGKIALPYTTTEGDKGWFCIDPPPQAPEEGLPCEDEGAFSDELECVGGFWQEPKPGRLCSSESEGMHRGDLHCAGGHWNHPEWNGPCNPSGSFNPDHTLHCVDATWQPAADGRPCRLPGQYHPNQSLYCGTDQRWHAVAEGKPCPKQGERGPGRRDLICYDGHWRKVLNCLAASLACFSHPIPGRPPFHCWSMAGGGTRCDP